MSYTRFSTSAVLLLLAVGCIGPQGAQPCADAPSDASADSGSSGDAKGEEPLVEAVVPTGTLIWDGTSTSNNGEALSPPGSWFVYSDKSPKGEKMPPSVEEFMSAVQNGALHTTGKGYTEWAAASAPT